MKTLFVPDFEGDSRQPANENKNRKGFNTVFQLIRQFLDFEIIPIGNVDCVVSMLFCRVSVHCDVELEFHQYPSRLTLSACYADYAVKVF